MIPKVKVFLDFMAAHLGTDLDPRLHGLKAKECFAGTVGQQMHAVQKKVPRRRLH
jgi:hypothetical protein